MTFLATDMSFTKVRHSSSWEVRTTIKSFAVLQLSGCAGCEVALLNAREWTDQLALAYMPLVVSAYDVPEVDILLVSGGVRTDEDLYKLQRAARRAGQLAAVGTCAISEGFLCIGTSTRGDCRALRTRPGHPCVGCRGPSDAFIEMELEQAVGRVVRAFDPCIACATH